MKRKHCSMVAWAAVSLLALTFDVSGSERNLRALPGHRPRLLASLVAQDQLPPTNHLHLAIGLPLRDGQGLDNFLEELYNPASANYHRYLAPEEFTARFGPTAEAYQAVLQFANTNGLVVTGTHSNRLLVDVEGSVESIQRAFHVSMLRYRHPKEERDFFAPDTDPSVQMELPIADVSGLNNYVLPHPQLRSIEPGSSPVGASPRGGSSPTGSYMGKDFRAAYLPDVTLTGTGQMVGLLQFDGFYAGDITAYEAAAGLPNVPLQTVLLDGYDGVPTTGPNTGNNEVSLDIEMVISMAPGLSKVVVFEAGPNGIPNDILNSMAANSQVKQFSCSWGWGGGPSTTTDNIFKQMAAQGQSFFTASGDSDAYTTGATSANGVDNTSLGNSPASSPYITVVGGTTLTTTGPGGAWASEKVWNWGLRNGSYAGTGGGISSHYGLPTWQSGISMASNGGSTTQRNIPDVALSADNVYVLYGNGSSGSLGGTSCAAPLWAGVAALVNQQAQVAGKSAVGFFNPAIYGLGKGPSASAVFHDITSGNNFSGSSPALFSAATGYDLCTGWGTPAGQALIDGLSGSANALAITPAIGTAFSGPPGGPFAPSAATFVLTNSSAASFKWSLVNTSAWLEVSATSGTLAGSSASQLSASLTPTAYSLAPGAYEAALVFTNQGGGAFAVSSTLSVGQSVLRNGDFESGDFTGWTLVGNTVTSGNVYNAVEDASSGFTVIHSGTYGAFMGDTQLASLSQSFPTVPGLYYLVSLWLDNPATGTGQQFRVNWLNDGTVANSLFQISSPPVFAWTNLQFLVAATGSTGTLQLKAENDSNYFGVDDVSVTPIPLPEFQTLAKTANGIQLSWMTTPGLLYQVQYTTDLLHGNWVNMGNSFTASSYSATVNDNGAGASGQRFYRLMVAP